MTIAYTVVFTLLGYAGGIKFTDYLIKTDETWSKRIGSSRWSYANLPVGGVVVGIMAAIFESMPLAGMAIGMAVAAIQWRFLVPLDPISDDRE